MKIKSILLSSILALGTAAITTIASAKTVNLYDQPAANGKITGSVDLSAGVIPIFTPKSGDWVKIADPRNGNVGWVKSSDLNNGNANTFTFTQKVINDDKGQHSYQIIEYGNPQKLTPEQMKGMLTNIQIQQQNVQQSIQKNVQHLINDINSMYKNQWEFMNLNGGLPIIMPIVIVPTNKTSTPSAPATSTTPQKK